jgi:hypothetical protein
MAMKYEELDDRTRQHMLSAFDREQASADPYRSKALSAKGLAAFPKLMREAVTSGNEESLALALTQVDFWEPEEDYVRDGIKRKRKRNVPQAATRLALTEFSTWYVLGFAHRLRDEGVQQCQIYRGAEPKWEPGECADHEGKIVAVEEIIASHRVRYWPEPGNADEFSIPFSPLDVTM